MYYAYTRVSTSKQGIGVSLEEQRDAIARYAATHRLPIAAWFEERETAARQGRPVFNQMVAVLKTGALAGVIFHKVDRGARNLQDWAEIAALIEKGVEIHFAGDSLDLQNRSGRLSADIQAVIAADYIRNLREETCRGFLGRIKQGLYPLPAPIGYLNTGGGKAKTIDPERGPLIRTAFSLYATGEFTLAGLALKMAELGLQNRQGLPVPVNTWARILRNPFYAGCIRLHAIPAPMRGRHEPLVSEPLFEAVQCRLAERAKRKTYRHEFLFRRMIRCGGCGITLIGEAQKGHRYYRCHTRGCETKCVREEAAEQAASVALSEICSTIHPGWFPIYEKSSNSQKRIVWHHLGLQISVRGKQFDVHTLEADTRDTTWTRGLCAILEEIALAEALGDRPTAGNASIFNVSPGSIPLGG